MRPLLWRFAEDNIIHIGDTDHLTSLSTNTTLNQCQSCPLLCTTTIYDHEISSTVYPSLYYYKLLLESNATNLKDETWEKFSRNRLLLNVYYKNMMLEVHEEKREFTFIAFLSSIGGFIGLFLGASLLSIFEFLEFVITLFVPAKIKSLVR